MGNTCGVAECRERPSTQSKCKDCSVIKKNNALTNGLSVGWCLSWCVPSPYPFRHSSVGSRSDAGHILRAHSHRSLKRVCCRAVQMSWLTDSLDFTV